MGLRSTQLTKKCSTEKGVLHGMHSGLGSRFSNQECVRRVCPILHRARVTSSLRSDLYAYFQSPSVAFTECSLFVSSISHWDCQIDCRWDEIADLKSVKGTLTSEMFRVKADLTLLSAVSLPLMQHVQVSSKK